MVLSWLSVSRLLKLWAFMFSRLAYLLPYPITSIVFYYYDSLFSKLLVEFWLGSSSIMTTLGGDVKSYYWLEFSSFSYYELDCLWIWSSYWCIWESSSWSRSRWLILAGMYLLELPLALLCWVWWVKPECIRLLMVELTVSYTFWISLRAGRFIYWPWPFVNTRESAANCSWSCGEWLAVQISSSYSILWLWYASLLVLYSPLL